MADTTFDPAHAVRFDLAHGTVERSQGAAGESRQVLIPASALEQGGAAMGRVIGAAIGARVASRLGAAAGASSVEDFATALGGELALSGFGMARVERWGRALVIAIASPAAGAEMIGALVEAAIETAAGKKARCALLAGDRDEVRFLLASESAASRVRDWIGAGTPWAEALSRLHTSGAKSGGAA